MFKIRREDTTKGVSKIATPSDFNTNLTQKSCTGFAASTGFDFCW